MTEDQKIVPETCFQAFENRLSLGAYLWPPSESDRRARDVAQTKADAAECDCWKAAAPICARCKLKAASTAWASGDPQ